jgi:hypothetical protein
MWCDYLSNDYVLSETEEYEGQILKRNRVDQHFLALSFKPTSFLCPVVPQVQRSTHSFIRSICPKYI